MQEQIKLIIDGSLRLAIPLAHKERFTLVKRVKDDCTFTNPKYVSLIKAGRRPWNCPKTLSLCDTYDKNGYKVITTDRGYAASAMRLLDEQHIEYTVVDHRSPGAALPAAFPAMMNITFRADQQQLIAQSLSNLSKIGGQQGIICAPTGSGKTLMTIEIARLLGRRVMVLTHVLDLAKQWQRTLLEKAGQESVIIGAGKWPDSDDVNFALVMAQTAMRNRLKWAQMSQGFGTLILEETHHAPVLTWRTLCWHAACWHRIGISATPQRNDGLTRAVELVCGDRLGTLSIDEVVAQGGITPARICPYLREWSGPTDFDGWTSFISHLIQDEQRNLMIANMACVSAQKMRVLVLTDRVDHAETLACIISSINSNVVLAHGRLRKGERVTAFEDMASAQITVGTFHLLGEGIDVPGWSAIILATPMSSRGKTLQSIGRITRPMPDKRVAWVADLIDNHPLAWSSWHKRRATYNRASMEIEKMRVAVPAFLGFRPEFFTDKYVVTE